LLLFLLLPFFLSFNAKRAFVFAFAFAFLSVIPAGNLLLSPGLSNLQANSNQAHVPHSAALAIRLRVRPASGSGRFQPPPSANGHKPTLLSRTILPRPVPSVTM
jgi:hypothetical protein